MPNKDKRLTASVTELLGFQSCRRRWYLGRLYGSRASSPALYFGAGVHSGLEGYFKWKKLQPKDVEGRRVAAQEAFSQWAKEQEVVLREEYGSMLWPFAQDAFYQMVDIGRKILDNYVEYDQQATVSLRPILVEKRLYIPLDEEWDDSQPGSRNGNGNGFKKRALNVLTMRWDLLAQTDNGLIGPADHKTSSGWHATGSALDIDEQMTGYAYGYYRMHRRQRVADVVIYDVLAKKVPAEPRVLKSGKLSKAKSQDTTHSKMLQAIADNGLDASDYQETLDALEARGWDSYFSRELSPRNRTQVENYEARARHLFQEMRAVLLHPELAIPSPSTINCSRCPFLQPCIAMEDGSDAQQLLESSFVRLGKTAWTPPPRFKTG